MELTCDTCKKPGKVTWNGHALLCPRCLTKTRPPSPPNWSELVSPKNLEQFVGQDSAKSELETMVLASKKHKLPVQHTLLSGGYGLGKTTLGKLFAGMVGEYSLVMASDIRQSSDIPDDGVVIVDELPPGPQIVGPLPLERVREVIAH